MEKETKKPFWRKIYGFRSATPWKMIVAGLSYWCLVLMAFLTIILIIFQGNEPKSKQQVVVASVIDASSPISIEDFVIKGVKLGEPVSSVVKMLGEPKNKTRKQEGVSYNYSDIEVIVNARDIIINVVTDQKTVSTRRGIHPGSQFAEVKKAYGDSYRKTELPEKDLYEYTFSPTADNPYILRFAVDRSSNIVAYIGCRILSEVETTALAYVKINGKWGYIGPTGKMMIDPQFDEARDFSEGLAPVKLNNKWGYIDAKNNIVIAFQYDGAFSFNEGLAAVGFKGDKFGISKWGYIDTTGKMVIAPQFSSGYKFSQGLALVTTNHGVQFIDTTGKMVIDLQHNGSFYFSEGLAPVSVNGKWGYIDTTGKMVIAPQFVGTALWGLGAAGDFSQGLACVKVNGKKYGFIDKTGKIVIQPQYDTAGDFSDGLAPVGISGERGKKGYIDTTGKMVITPQFDSAWNFSQGLARVQVSNKWGYIDTTGKMVIAPQYDEAGEFKK